MSNTNYRTQMCIWIRMMMKEVDDGGDDDRDDDRNENHVTISV